MSAEKERRKWRNETGTSWGTYAVMFPVAMPLAWAVQPDVGYASVCFGAVLGGGIKLTTLAIT